MLSLDTGKREPIDKMIRLKFPERKQVMIRGDIHTVILPNGSRLRFRQNGDDSTSWAPVDALPDFIKFDTNL